MDSLHTLSSTPPDTFNKGDLLQSNMSPKRRNLIPLNQNDHHQQQQQDGGQLTPSSPPTTATMFPPLTPNSTDSSQQFQNNNNTQTDITLNRERNNNNILRPDMIIPSSPSKRTNSNATTPTSINNPTNNQKHGKSNKEENLKLVPCKFFKNGACTAGKNCMFSHDIERFQTRAQCKYFLKGNCKFGSKCALAHIYPGDRTGGIKQQFSHIQQSGMNMVNMNSNAMGIPKMQQQLPQQQLISMGMSPPGPIGSPTSFQQHQQHLGGNRGVLLSMSYESDHGGYGSSPSMRLGRISEERRIGTKMGMTRFNYDHHNIHRNGILDDDDDQDDSNDAFKFEEDFLPSSLNELLTPDELDRRRTRQEDPPYADPLAARMKSLGGGVASMPRDDILFHSRLHSRMSWTSGTLGGINGGLGGTETGSLPGGLNGYHSPLSNASVFDGSSTSPPQGTTIPTAITIPSSLQYRASLLSSSLPREGGVPSPSLHSTFQAQSSQLSFRVDQNDDDGEMPFVMEDEVA